MLTPEQEKIASAPPDARLLVTAGAGTGKTHVLIDRLQTLAEEHELALADEVLVMSFSRAAVGEVRRRMNCRGGALPYGTVVTFDSFASRLLSRHAQAQTWAGMSFDERIEAAHDLLETSDDAQNEIARLRHVIVDEVQDLVGVRRMLVQTILEHCDGGFTLFGDPAQGIYNFQADDPQERQLGSLLFFEWVQHELRGTPVETATLTKNFRYETDEARVAEWAGPLLNGNDPKYHNILESLEDTLFDVEALGGLDDLVDELAGRTRHGTLTESIGILCHYNFEVLRVSEKLATEAVPHHYQRPASDRSVPAWVARALRGCDTGQVGRRRFEDLVAPVREGAADAWSLVKRLDTRSSRDTLDLQKVQERIRLGDIPPELSSPPVASIVVSTIHRAKGLEFDRVVLFEPGPPLEEDDDQAPERARQLYVALTRAKRRYGALERLPREYFKKQGNPGDIWAVYGFQGQRRYVREIEIQGRYSWSQDPAGAFAFEDDAETLQQYLEAEVKPLDPLRLRRTTVDLGEGPRVFYVIEHAGRDVGVADIGWIISRLCRPRYERNWPAVIDGLFVESVDTVAGTSAAGLRAGLTSSGLWLRVRPYGLGRFHWERQ